MSKYRYTAIIATVANSFCDTVLDYAVYKFNYYKVLFLTSIVAMLWQLGIGTVTEIKLSINAIPYIVIHAFIILVGYICFVKALKYIPIALVGLLEASSLFLTFIIDAIVGYVTVSLYFMTMLGLFVFSIWLFTEDCKKNITSSVKVIKPIGFVWVLLSVLLYLSAPYLVKAANFYGANEIAINLGYYLVAVPYFLGLMIKTQEINNKITYSKTKWSNNLYLLALIIGSLEAIYYIFETFSFINDAPTIVIVIAQMRVFLLFVLSVIFKTDRFTFQKLLALALGCIAVVGVYFS